MTRGEAIGFLGTGLMGGPMARNLGAAGFRVTVWNRSPEKAQALAPHARAAPCPAAAVEGACAVVVMLSSGPVCHDVLFGAHGAASALPCGAMLIVMSSIGFDEARSMAARAGELGLRWIDAPVSGGTRAAEDGTLSIMAGGPQDTVEEAHGILSTMGHVVHVGPEGTGALVKLANQIAVASTIVAVSEALLLAEVGGADPGKAREALMRGFAASRILDLHGARMIRGDFAPGGPAKYQLKDTRAARAVAEELGLDLPALNLADHLFAKLVDHGGGDLDHAALFLELKRRNGRLSSSSGPIGSTVQGRE